MTSSKESRRPRAISAKEKLIEYYRELRAKEWQDRKNGIKKATKRPKRKNKRYNKVRKKIVKKTPPKIIRVNENDQKIEIEQNLSYYCMKNRKSSKFSSEADCFAYTESVKMECLDKFEKGDARLTTCVKSRIKN